MFTTIERDINRAINKARKDTETMHLGGLTPEDTATGKWPYDELLDELQRGIAEVQALKNHTHTFGEFGYCTICDADGNA